MHLTAAIADGILEVAVSDHEPQLSMPYSRESVRATAAFAATMAEGGRGMGLVDAISDECGISTLGPGKQVWFRLPVDEDWAHRTDCVCHRKS